MLALAGLVLGTLLIGWFGFGHVAATLAAVGWGGLALVVAWQMLMFVVLAAGWAVLLPHQPGHFALILGARMVRDAAGNCLPFSRLGGFVLGARALTLGGIGWPVAAASSVVDITVEFLAQIAFIAAGLAILVIRAPASPFTLPVAAVLGLALVAGAMALWLQRGGGGLFIGLLHRITRRLLHDRAEQIALLQSELSLIAGHSPRLLLGIALHALGWIATAIASWIAFRLVGAPIDFATALAIEALLHAVLAASFLVPGNIGVQEAAYVGLAVTFGLPPEAALGVSLLRRARDVAVGVPILLGWQLAEMRHLRVR